MQAAMTRAVLERCWRQLWTWHASPMMICGQRITCPPTHTFRSAPSLATRARIDWDKEDLYQALSTLSTRRSAFAGCSPTSSRRQGTHSWSRSGSWQISTAKLLQQQCQLCQSSEVPHKGHPTVAAAVLIVDRNGANFLMTPVPGAPG